MPEEIGVSVFEGLFEDDPELMAELRACGLDDAQINEVCAVLGRRIMPLLEDLMAAVMAEHQTEHLVTYFGGEERWDAIRRQLQAWGTSMLPQEAFEALTKTADGVKTLYRLMTHAEPNLGSYGRVEGGPQRGAPLARWGSGESLVLTSEEDLRTLMRDPRYWRDRDPALVRRVREGYERLYPK